MTPSFTITIDGSAVSVTPGQTVLTAARKLGVDIPTLCYLEKCGPLNSCLACVVKINGKLVPSCGTKVEPGMLIESETEEVHEARRTALELLFSDHVGDCLSPCHRLCPLGLNVPVMIRQIETGKLQQATATVRNALPLAGVLGRLCHHPCEQGCRRGNWDDPAAIRDLERFVTDQELNESREMKPEVENTPHRESAAAGGAAPVSAGLLRRRNSGKSVVIVGSGPAGLSAAFHLVRSGHRVTVVDRRERAGGALRSVSEELLPRAVLEREISLLVDAGVEFKLKVELGEEITIEGLSRGFDAILLALGEVSAAEAERLGVLRVTTGLKADPNTCQTPLRGVFATGAAVKPLKQLVRAMAEGRAAAECIHRFLTGQPVRRPEKPFSSIMGRLEPGELRTFLATSIGGGSVTPCDRCSGLNSKEAATEATRCLHCDCRSSGNCLLQHYAQVYGADASRFRSERRTFEQVLQPGGIVFEPGKCIVCGICVRLTELAQEPLGLTFIGRGFDVRIGPPLNRTIEEGLQKIADECVRQCPTGALEWSEKRTPQAETR